MAAARHNLTRRAVLGAGAALCALPARARGEALGAATQRRWARALAGLRRAEGRLAAWREAEARLAPELRRWPHSERLDERFGDLDSIRLDALRRLLGTAAPDLTSLSLKIDLAVDEEVATLTGGEACLAVLKADARRLARGS